jgi:hypothetical protein
MVGRQELAIGSALTAFASRMTAWGKKSGQLRGILSETSTIRARNGTIFPADVHDFFQYF